MRACINNQQIRHHNKCVILELLYRQKRANKSTLARLAQISIPAVSNILQELESEKRVRISTMKARRAGIVAVHG